MEALNTLALVSGQTDPITEVIAQALGMIQGYLAAGRQNMGASGTIPSQLLGPALAIIRWNIGGRLAAGGAANIFQTESRRKEYEDAMDLLKDVVARRFIVETPAVANTDETFTQPSPEWGGDETLEF